MKGMSLSLFALLLPAYLGSDKKKNTSWLTQEEYYPRSLPPRHRSTLAGRKKKPPFRGGQQPRIIFEFVYLGEFKAILTKVLREE
jgi:hypothetical protein